MQLQSRETVPPNEELRKQKIETEVAFTLGRVCFFFSPFQSQAAIVLLSWIHHFLKNLSELHDASFCKQSKSKYRSNNNTMTQCHAFYNFKIMIYFNYMFYFHEILTIKKIWTMSFLFTPDKKFEHYWIVKYAKLSEAR